MKKILYFIQLPPPIHGVSSINKFIYESKMVNANIKKRKISINYSDDLNKLGKASVNKILILIRLWLQLLYSLTIFRPSLVYFTIVPLGSGFIRDLIFVILFKIFNVKTIYHLHGNGISDVRSKFKIRLYRFVFSDSVVIHLSEGLLKKEIIPLKLKNSTLYSVPNGTDEISDVPYKKKKNEKINILYLSNYSESKGLFVLINAIKILKQNELKFHLRVVGKPFNINKSKLDNLIKLYNLNEYISFVGPKYKEGKDREFRKADIFVFPTLNDTFPLVIIEAMKYSLPVVSSAEGAIPEIIEDGKTGFIVDKGDYISVANRLERLIKNESLREAMGKNGYIKFKNEYTINVFEDRMAEIFKQNLD